MRQYDSSPSSLVEAATCVWNQYYPEDHNVGIRQPGETRSAQYYSPISDTDGRFQAAMTFLTCFRDGEQWAPLLQVNVTVVWLHYTELIRTGTADFERAVTENIEDVLLCLGVALCMRRHELRVEAEEDVTRKRSVPVDRTKITVRLHGVTPVLPIAALKADVVNQFVSVVGTVVRVSAIKPLVTRCDFVCAKCNEATSRAFPDGKFLPPQRCENSPCRGRTLLPNRSSVDTVDYQKIKLQEMETIDVGPGRMPRMIEVELYEDLVDSCIPGNVVTVSGIVKSINSEIHEGRYSKRAQANSLYILYISANSVENAAKVDKGKNNASDIDFTKEDLEQISYIINQGNVFDHLVHSLCPGIYRNDIVKAGLILALLGGTRNSDDKDSACVRRADSHVLVVGDPGLGKSQLLRAVSMVAPRAVYVGGNTTTTTGLTVTMVKDGSGDYALEAGALVLADQGVCCIDEFDKMGIDYQALLEAMEQQSISIAKAGIVCNLNARTSVIAAANPSGGHYDRSRSVGENLKMKAALLSRFDLVFILLDRPDEERDRLLSEHVMNSHARGKRKARKRTRDSSAPMSSWSSSSYADEPPAGGYEDAPGSSHRLLSHRLRQNASEYSMNPIPLYFVRKFIAYARRYVHPRLSSEAATVLQKKYLELRSAGEGQQNPTDSIPITTRQLESLIRLSQARARAELAETVSAEHAQDVVDIMQECLLDTFVTEDGNLDFGRSGGMSLAKKVKAYVARLMKAAARRNTSLFSMDDLLEVADSMGLKVDDFRDFVDILRNECYLLKKGPGQFKVQVSSYNMILTKVRMAHLESALASEIEGPHTTIDLTTLTDVLDRGTAQPGERDAHGRESSNPQSTELIDLTGAFDQVPSRNPRDEERIVALEHALGQADEALATLRDLTRRMVDDHEAALTCPISYDLFEDPVVTDCCGKTFSSAALTQYEFMLAAIWQIWWSSIGRSGPFWLKLRSNNLLSQQVVEDLQVVLVGVIGVNKSVEPNAYAHGLLSLATNRQGHAVQLQQIHGEAGRIKMTVVPIGRRNFVGGFKDDGAKDVSCEVLNHVPSRSTFGPRTTSLSGWKFERQGGGS